MKRFVLFLILLVGGGVYVRKHYGLRDALAYARRHPDPELSPKIAYYAGMAYYLRDRYPEAEEAFTQLLSDYPTSYYAPKALLRSGTIYTSQNRWAPAREVYQRYMDEFPEGPDTGIVRTRYEAIKFR